MADADHDRALDGLRVRLARDAENVALALKHGAAEKHPRLALRDKHAKAMAEIAALDALRTDARLACADAWDEGEESGLVDGPHGRNPYREGAQTRARRWELEKQSKGGG